MQANQGEMAETRKHGEAAAMLAGLVAVGGLALLLLIAVRIGVLLDVEVHRRERRHLAQGRRLRWNAWQEDRAQPDRLCDGCPYRQ